MDTDSITRLGVAAARRALALDSTLVEAHLALASALSNEMRLEDAEAEFRRVITLAPNNPTVHQWYATCLLGMGRVEEALAASRRAVALDPLSAVIINDQASVLLSARRYDDAFVAARRALELDSTFAYTRVVLAWLHGGHGASGQRTGAARSRSSHGPGPRLARLGLARARRLGLRHRGAARGRRAGAGGDRAGAGRALAATTRRWPRWRWATGRARCRALARSLERHELLGLDPSPGCTPVFDPLYRLSSFQRLMARYDIRVCDR